MEIILSQCDEFCILKDINWSRNYSKVFDVLISPVPTIIVFAFAGAVSATRSFLHFRSWARSSQNSLSYMLISMNVQRQLKTFVSRQLFISTEMVRGLMRCLVEEKSDCTTVCGCTLRSNFQYLLQLKQIIGSWMAVTITDYCTFVSSTD